MSADATPLEELERKVGRKFDKVQLWHGIAQRNIPTRKELRWAAEGRILHYNLASRHWGRTRALGLIRYRDIVAGGYDEAIAAQARSFARFAKPVFVTFDHEPDQKNRRFRGTPAQYVRAWRHVRRLYLRAGATNVIWTWVLTGYPPNFAKAPSVYPGNDQVDWIGWEAYNGAGCFSGSVDAGRYRTFEQAMLPFYQWLQTHGAKAGIATDKPYMIMEFGTAHLPRSPHITANWFRGIPATLRKYPKIRAVQLWHNTYEGTCDFRVTGHPLVTKAFADAGRDPYLNHHLPPPR